jgi:1-deoxy-D-xylulose-5-phosphate synthase
VTVTAPKDGREMLGLLRTAVQQDRGPFSIRYPRDAAPDSVPAISQIDPVPYGTWEVMRHGSEIAILATGTMVLPAVQAADTLAAEGLRITVVNCRFLKPYDEVTLAAVLADHTRVLVIEEGTVVNGFGAYMSTVIARQDPSIRVAVHGVPDRIVPAASRARQLAITGLDANGIGNRVRALHEQESEAVAG